jgi:hypothetical protein
MLGHGAPGRRGGPRDAARGERAPHGGDVPSRGVEARVQHHVVALAEHVDRAPEGHHDVLHPLATSSAEGRGGAGELHERGDVVAVGEADLDEHVTAPTVDGVDGLCPRGPQ